MRRTAGAFLFAIILTALTLAGAHAPALAVEWPAPPDEWWEDLSPGDTATFEISVDAQPPTKMKLIIKVLDVKGSKITFSTKTSMDGKSMPEQVQTVDAKSVKTQSSLPGYAAVTKTGEKVFKVGTETLKCTEYLVKTYDTSTHMCYSPEIPIIFNNGNVIMENKSSGITSTMTLKEYTGKMLEK